MWSSGWEGFGGEAGSGSGEGESETEITCGDGTLSGGVGFFFGGLPRGLFGGSSVGVDSVVFFFGLPGFLLTTGGFSAASFWADLVRLRGEAWGRVFFSVRCVLDLTDFLGDALVCGSVDLRSSRIADIRAAIEARFGVNGTIGGGGGGGGESSISDSAERSKDSKSDIARNTGV